MRTDRRHIRTHVLVLLLVMLLGGLLALETLYPRAVASDTTSSLGGYLWSDTIGWVSLHGSNYGISMDQNGKLSGYAWSDSVGWISANDADLVGCPSNPCTAKFNSNQLTGWLKVLANGGGWDGFISLSGSNYGVTLGSDGSMTGYAWGDQVVGWLDFHYSTPFPPSCTLQASPTSITRGNNVSLTWTSLYATSGSIAPGSIALSPASSGSTAVQPNTSTTYIATVTGAGGSAQCSASVTVSCAPYYSCSGSNVTYTDASCNTSTVATCTAPAYCSAGQPSCQYPSISENPNGTNNTSGHLQARPNLVTVGGSAKLYWDISNATSCTVTGGGQQWNTLSSGSNGVSTGIITTTTRYTMHCAAYSGQSNLDESLDVLVRPDFNEN